MAPLASEPSCNGLLQLTQAQLVLMERTEQEVNARLDLQMFVFMCLLVCGKEERDEVRWEDRQGADGELLFPLGRLTYGEMNNVRLVMMPCLWLKHYYCL